MTDLLFLLIWGNEPMVHWSKFKGDVNSFAKVRWRGTNKTVHLAVDGMDYTLTKPKKINPSRYYPLLKSNLQKQIRRGSTADAMRTAIHMWEDDPFSLLWRLPIIAVEDSELFKEISVIIWLMSAYSKGLVPTDQHRDYVLRVVGNVCENRSCLYYTMIRSKYEGKRVEYEHLKGMGTKHILRSFLYRTAYNSDKSELRLQYDGNEGDVAMLLKAVSYYVEFGTTIPEITKLLITPSPRLAILQASADFHVNPMIIGDLREIAESKGVNCTPEEIKTAIWQRSSRRNVRIAYSPPEKRILKIYRFIEENFNMMAVSYIKRVMDGSG